MAVDAKLLNINNGDQPGARQTEHCRLPQLWARDPDPFEKSPHCWRAIGAAEAHNTSFFGGRSY